MPKFHSCYDAILDDFSVSDVTHRLHDLLEILGNMQRLEVDGFSADCRHLASV